VSKDELVACIPYLLVSVEDRNAEVRKNAQDAILPFMIHVGYEAMNRQLSKLPVSFVYRLSGITKSCANICRIVSVFKPYSRFYHARQGKDSIACKTSRNQGEIWSVRGQIQNG
jgi:hypothetical protein